MKMLKGLVAVSSIALSAHAFAIPDFDTLADDANSVGGNITKSNFNYTPLTFDEIWTKEAGAEVKFKAEISGFDNKMGYADINGDNRTTVLDEGDEPGDWISIGDAPDPFVFFLDTGNYNWFSKDSLNSDEMDHMLAFQYADNSSRYILFWDDQDGEGNSDRDFNDFVARVNFVHPVPEPGTLALLGLGLAGLGLSRRRKQH